MMLSKVLFEIEANPTVTTKPFADITKLSAFGKEKEVLVMVGSVFRIMHVNPASDNSGVWIIQMTLCSDDDHDLKPIFEHLKNEHGGGEKSLLTFANVLTDMGKFDEAKNIIFVHTNSSLLVTRISLDVFMVWAMSPMKKVITMQVSIGTNNRSH